MKKIKDWLLSSTKNKVIFSCGIVALVAIICVASFFIYKKAIKHEHTVDYKYECLNDGTHKKTSYCTDEDGKKCKDFHSETTVEKCEFDKDGICKYCGYSKYVTVKFLSNIDDSVVKEMKVERGTTLDSNKDFPEVPTVEGYEFVHYDGNFANLKTDTTITLVYNPISEEKKEETSTNSNNNSNSSSQNNANNTSANNNNESDSNNDDESNDNSAFIPPHPDITQQDIMNMIDDAAKRGEKRFEEQDVQDWIAQHGFATMSSGGDSANGNYIKVFGTDGESATFYYE